MGLHDALDDISGGVTNLDATDNLSGTEVIPPKEDNSPFKVGIESFNPEIVQRFNKHHDLVAMKASIAGVDKIGRDVALEVFAMLPAPDPVDQARLTQNPSYINKELVDNVLRDVENVIPDDILAHAREVVEIVRQNKDNSEKTLELCAHFEEAFKAQGERFKNTPPIVIVDGASRNLYTDKILDVNYVDYSKCSYPKYETGELRTMYRNLLDSESLNALLEELIPPPADNVQVSVKPVYEASLEDLCRHLQQAFGRAKGAVNSFNNALKSADNLNSTQIQTSNIDAQYLVNEAQHLLDDLKFMKMLFDILSTKDNCFEKIDGLMAFID